MAVYHFRVNQRVFGKQISNGLYYDIDAPSETDLDDFCDDVATVWGNRVGSFSIDWELETIATRLIDGTGLPYVTRFTAQFNGTDSSQTLGSQVQVPLFFRSITGRPNRSWIQLAGFTEAGITNGVLEVPLFQTLQDMGSEFNLLTAPSGKTAQHVIARVSGNPQNVDAFNPVASWVLKSVISFDHGRPE